MIVYETVTSDQIHEVFSLYNKQGKHLNAEEIRNALYHNLDFMRALLVTAGDSDEVDAVAPFLSEIWDGLASTPEVLDSYGFGKAGYKRTKLLSWVAAALLFSDGRAPTRSTAAQVNALLKRIDDDGSDPLRNSDRVRDAMRLLDRALDAHAVIPDDVWSPAFKNAQSKSKWRSCSWWPRSSPSAPPQSCWRRSSNNDLRSHSKPSAKGLRTGDAPPRLRHESSGSSSPRW